MQAVLAMSRISVCLSFCQMRELWQNEETSAHMFIPYKR